MNRNSPENPPVGPAAHERKRISTAKRLRNRLIVGSAVAAGRLVPMLGLETIQSLGSKAGGLLALVPGTRRQRVEGHLQIAFPDWDDSRRRKVLRDSYRSMAQLFLESIWVPAWRKERDDQRVVILHPGNWKKTFDLLEGSGRGLLVYTAHLGTPEIMGTWFPSVCPRPIMAVAARPKIKELEGPMLERRQQGGIRIVFRGDAGTATYRHLKAGGVLISFVDHNLKGEGVDMPFFGKPAHTLLAPAKLALQSGSVVNTLFALRDGQGRFLVHCDEPIEVPKYARDAETRFRQECELIAEYTRRIEKAIRLYPDQYLWMHKRWQKRSDTLPIPC